MKKRENSSESFRFLLDVLQRRLAPLPSLGAGGHHTVVLWRSTVFSFGADDSSQLGLGESNVPRHQLVDESAYRTVPERVGQPPGRVVSVTAGSDFCLAMARPALETQNKVGLCTWGWIGSGVAALSIVDGRIFAWGQGDCELLGQGTDVDCLVPTLVDLCGE